MDNVGKVDTSVMKECSQTWNLANDVDLLKRLESFSQHVLNNTTYALHCMDSLEGNLNKTFLNVRTITNNFHAIADNQFIENRVQEEDDSLSSVHPDEPSSMEWSTERSDVQLDLHQTLKKCADILEKKFETVDIPGSDSEDDAAIGRQIMLIPKNVYKDRPLPHLIGSKGFNNDDTLGLSSLQIEEDMGSESEDESTNQSGAPTSSEQSDYNMVSDPSKNNPEIVSTDGSRGYSFEDKVSLKSDEFKKSSPAVPNHQYENGGKDTSETDGTSIRSYSSVKDSFIEPSEKSLTTPPKETGISNKNDFKADLARVLSMGRASVGRSKKAENIFSPDESNEISSPKEPDPIFSQKDPDPIFSKDPDPIFSPNEPDRLFSFKDDLFSSKNLFTPPPLMDDDDEDDDMSNEMEVDRDSSPDLFLEPPARNIPEPNKHLSIEDITTISQGVSDLPCVTTKVLQSLAKGRAKIQSKRKLPSRRHRKEGFNPSGVAVDPESISKPLPSTSSSSKPTTSSTILSPMTDEEDLFVLPAFDFPRDISSTNLFFGNTLLSPGVSIDAEKNDSEQGVPFPQINQGSSSVSTLPKVESKEEKHDPLWLPSTNSGNQSDKFSWDMDSSDTDDLFSIATKNEDSILKTETFSKVSIHKDSPLKTQVESKNEENPKPIKVEKASLKPPADDLFSNDLDDEDDDFLISKTGIFSKNSKTSLKTNKESLSLFKDDDEDDELFFSSAKTPAKKTDQDLFGSVPSSAKKALSAEEESDDLFKDSSSTVKDPLFFTSDFT